MEKKIDSWLKQILLVLFHFGAVTLPLVFAFNTDELFEFNKMLFVYGWVSIALALWFARMVVRRQLLFAKTPLDLPIIGFLITQLVSTIFSIHPYTSLYGYYSRFHGGLLSTLSYIGLYYVFISTFWSEEDNVPKPLLQRPVVKWLLSAGLGITLASLYAFPEHFGHSISCQLATNSFNVSCWVQDVQNRVFGTFGQPNWLAAYLIMLIPLALGSIWLFSKSRLAQGLAVGAALLWYSVLLFTKSRSGLLGLGFGVAIMIAWLGVSKLLFARQKKTKTSPSKQASLVIVAVVVACLAVPSLLFGTPVTPSLQQLLQPAATQPVENVPRPAGPALEVGGTESGEIRKIVWKGALDVWRKYPLVGSGVETFAYSYYQSRPASHNLVSEWDFLYNKAHNEWLNTLATTGLLGFIAFIVLMASPFLLSIIWLIKTAKKPADQQNSQAIVLVGCLLAGLAALHVSNFFGFSTVAVTTLEFLFLGVLMLLQNNVSLPEAKKIQPLGTLQYLLLVGLGILALTAAGKILSIRQADVLFSQGKTEIQQGQVALGSDDILNAIKKRPQEASYYSTLGNYYASIATQLAGQNQATQAATLAVEADTLLASSTQVNPVHYTLYLSQIGGYMQLAKLNPSWLDKAMTAVDQAKILSPTDPRPWLMEGKILAFQDQYEPALQRLQKAIDLKPNYLEARSTLAQVYELMNNQPAALEQYKYMLENISPDDTLLKEKVASLEGKVDPTKN
ncbi:O-antigen ligase family protein [Candidatus Woesebacteria bacterium]|nr:O-antigen ligase family protein [Candidatus Woesebacteria bacterium]